MPVPDPMMIQSKLNELAEEFKTEGYLVERKVLGVVVLKLDDGEVHFVPGNGEIRRVVFKHG